jgi:hypothetical protein
MSTLTQQERDGLEDVFLSIHANKNRYKRIKELSPLVITHQISIIVAKLLKRANFGLKKSKNYHFLAYFHKKKKSLSK